MRHKVDMFGKRYDLCDFFNKVEDVRVIIDAVMTCYSTLKSLSKKVTKFFPCNNIHVLSKICSRNMSAEYIWL